MTSQSLKKRLRKLRKELEGAKRQILPGSAPTPEKRRRLRVAGETRIKIMPRNKIRPALKNSIPEDLKPYLEAIAFRFTDVGEYGKFYSSHQDGRFIMVRIRQHDTGPIRHPAQYWVFSTRNIVEQETTFQPMIRLTAGLRREETMKAVKKIQQQLDALA